MGQLDELKQLLVYLIGHNDDHAKEVTELARQARDLGNPEASARLMEGIQLMQASNKKLEEGLDLIK